MLHEPPLAMPLQPEGVLEMTLDVENPALEDIPWTKIEPTVTATAPTFLIRMVVHGALVELQALVAVPVTKVADSIDMLD